MAALPRTTAVLTVLAGFTLVAVPVAPAAAAGQSRQTWHSQVVPSEALHLTSDSCPSDTDCFAVGWENVSGPPTAVIVATTDGGAQWVMQTVPTGLSQLNAVSCSSTLACIAVGYSGGDPDYSPAIAATTNGGSTWTAETAPAGGYQLNAVSCDDGSDCTAVGNTDTYGAAGITTADGGLIWTHDTLPPGTKALFGVSCPSTTTCTAVDLNTAVATTDGGENWQTLSTPPNLVNLSAISCPSVSDCVVVGRASSGPADIIGTSDGGHDWSTEPVPPGIDFSPDGGVACPSTTDCTAVGQSTTGGGAAIVGTADGGASWSTEVISDPALVPMSGVACASPTVCTSVGQNEILNRGGAAGSAPGPFYLALGDSVPVWDGPDSYPDLLLQKYQASDPGLKLVNLAVSGETTTSMLEDGQYGEAVAFLRAERRHVAFVTIDIGGNDVVGCALSSDPQCFPQALATMTRNLTTILAGLHAAAPRVPIFGMSYYDPVLGLWLSGGSLRQEVLGTLPNLVTLNNTLESLYGPRRTADVQGIFSVTDSFGRISSPWGKAPVDVVDACSWLDIECPSFGGDDPNDTGAVQIATAFEQVIGAQVSSLVVKTRRLPDGHIGRPYELVVPAAGGIPPYRWTLETGSLPTGFALDSATGEISGTPRGAGTAAFTLKVKDSSKPVHAETVSLSITVTR